MVNSPVAADPSWLTGGYFDTMRMQIMAWQITYHLPTGLSVEMSVAHDYSWHNEYDQSGSGSGTYRLSGSWKRKVGAAGQLAYTIATGSSELHKASSLGGSCGADPPEENGVCDWDHQHHRRKTGHRRCPGSQVDPKTGKPLDVTLTGPYDGLPVETGTASCTGDCDPDASGPTTGYDVAAVLTSKYGSTDPVRIDLRGWVKDKGTGDWLLRQSYEETSDIMLSGTQHFTGCHHVADQWSALARSTLSSGPSATAGAIRAFGAAVSRSCASSFVYRCSRCLRTVDSATPSWRPIVAAVAPVASSRRTSCSRGVRSGATASGTRAAYASGWRAAAAAGSRGPRRRRRSPARRATTPSRPRPSR